MTTQVGASPTQASEWHQINWQQCYRNVARLQARIVKATQSKQNGKVQALQWVLTHSFSAKAIAVRRVTENRGRKTPGIDGQTWSKPSEKYQAIGMLKRRGYHPEPVRRIYIPKANGKRRPIGIPNIKDRAMQALYLQSLDPVAETTADQCSYGFRPQRSTADAIERCYTVLANKQRASWILEGDIESCFDELNHEWLLNHVKMDRQILSKWLGAGYMERGKYTPSAKGSPQGGVISPVLANIALDGMAAMLQAQKELKGRKVNLVRYADDFIVTGDSEEILAQRVRPKIEEFLRERGLKLSRNKTRITHIESGIDFLGQNIRKYKGKLLIKPSQRSCLHLIKKVKKQIRSGRSWPASELIKKLNPIIRGWSYYHHHVVSKAIFNKMDRVITHQTWNWAKRKHPKKPRRWIKQQYFSRTPVWGQLRGKEEREKGKKREIYLEQAFKIPIRRHRLIKGEANPYANEWKEYFIERQQRHWTTSKPQERYATSRWRTQGGKCQVCQEQITEQTGWHQHHIQARQQGGKDELINLVLLHPTCHQQLHNNEEVARSITTEIG